MTSPDGGKRLRYMEIADDIRVRIRTGKLTAGSRVGTFGSLGEEYDAAKGTVDKALDVLRQEGAVVTIAGKGIYVVDGAAGVLAERPEDDIKAALRKLQDDVAGLKADVAELQSRRGINRAARKRERSNEQSG